MIHGQSGLHQLSKMQEKTIASGLVAAVSGLNADVTGSRMTRAVRVQLFSGTVAVGIEEEVCSEKSFLKPLL
jgi:hypothetical protein